ncbi:MAG: DUF2254 domain-containing protein, partial [Bacillota bacterium]
MNNRVIRIVKNKIYYIPVCYCVIAIILAIAVIILDNKFVELLSDYIPFYLFVSVDLAKTILSTLAGSLFGMVTISFSTIMVVLTMYSSQFSPRTMQDFLRDKVTLNVLGVFIGGFIYILLNLLLLQKSNESTIILSVDLSVVIAIICLGYFVFFIHHVANSVQVDFLIEKLRDEVIDSIEIIEKRNNKDDRIRNKPSENILELTTGRSQVVYANQSGYIQCYYPVKLAQYADRMDVFIQAEKRIGKYVTENSRIFTIWQYRKSKLNNIDRDNDVDRKIIIEDFNEIYNYIDIGKERKKKNDIEFGLLKLTEVALKAISPGINDQNTAVFCINQSGWILSKIAISNLENTYYYNNNDELCFIKEDIVFSELLYKTFYQLRLYGRQDYSITGAILDALLIIAEGSPNYIKKIVWEYAIDTMNGFDKKVLENTDKKYLNRKIYILACETDRDP